MKVVKIWFSLRFCHTQMLTHMYGHLLLKMPWAFFILLHFSIKYIFSWNKDDFISLVSTLFHRRMSFFFSLTFHFLFICPQFPLLIYLIFFKAFFKRLEARLSPATLFIYISLKALCWKGDMCVCSVTQKGDILLTILNSL